MQALDKMQKKEVEKKRKIMLRFRIPPLAEVNCRKYKYVHSAVSQPHFDVIFFEEPYTILCCYGEYWLQEEGMKKTEEKIEMNFSFNLSKQEKMGVIDIYLIVAWVLQ